MTGLHWICWFCWGAGHIYEFPNPWVLNVFPCVYVFSFIKVLHFSVYVSSSSLVVYSKVSYSFWYYCNFHFSLNFFFRKLINSIKMQLTFIMLILCSATLKHFYKVCSVQFSRSVVSDSATPWIAACQASLSITSSRSSRRFISIESVMPSSHLILCRPLLLLPPIPPSIKVFSNESTLRMRWPKYWSFNFSIIPSKEISGLISLNGLVGSPYSPRDPQESSPTPQFKSINSSALSLLHSPTLTSIHDHR